MRRSVEAANFAAGHTQVAALAPADRDLVLNRLPGTFYDRLHVRVAPLERRLPPSETLARLLPTLWGYQGGGQEHSVTGPDDILYVDWPSGWSVLEAVAHDRGFSVRPSRQGAAAMAFLRRLGGIRALGPLIDPDCLSLLRRLATRTGSQYFRQRVGELQARLEAADQSAAAQSDEIRRYLEELRTRPTDIDQTDLPFEAIKDVLGSRESRSWIRWAETNGLLIRGVTVVCDDCGARSWRAVGEIAPPVICRGCASRIEQPYPADHLKFRFRATEAVVDVMTLDAMPHVLALRWWAELLERHAFYGGHPGVEFIRGGRVVGEADVVLLFSTGTIAIGECKSHPAGLTAREISKLESLADLVGASWTFVATPEWASSCDPAWASLRRDLPDRPRYALTAEHLFADSILWTITDDPFAYTQATDAERNARRTSYREGLRRRATRPELATPRLDRLLLDDIAPP